MKLLANVLACLLGGTLLLWGVSTLVEHKQIVEKEQIKADVEAQGYTYEDAQYCTVFDSDPFAWYDHGKNVDIFKFEYKDKNKNVKTAYVRFAPLVDPKYIW